MFDDTPVTATHSTKYVTVLEGYGERKLCHLFGSGENAFGSDKLVWEQTSVNLLASF